MTYKNSRLKHVKKIIELVNKLDYVQYTSSYAGRILTQCNLLLETKKEKRCLCRKEHINPFESFIQENVEFDKNGRSRLRSSHGLAKLIRKFWKEVMPEIRNKTIEDCQDELHQDRYGFMCEGLLNKLKTNERD